MDHGSWIMDHGSSIIIIIIITTTTIIIIIIIIAALIRIQHINFTNAGKTNKLSPSHHHFYACHQPSIFMGGL